MSRRGSFRPVGGDPGVRADDPEPSLYALLDDPVTKLVMNSDGIHRTELLFMIEVARMRLRSHGRPARNPASAAPTPRAECRV